MKSEFSNSIKKFEKSNKLAFVLDRSKRSLVVCKGLFFSQLEDAVREEREWCKAHKLPQQMDDKKVREIVDLLEQCQDYFWVEALSQFVFQENIVPILPDLEAKARSVKQLSSIYIPGRSRSYSYANQKKF